MGAGAINGNQPAAINPANAPRNVGAPRKDDIPAYNKLIEFTRTPLGFDTASLNLNSGLNDAALQVFGYAGPEGDQAWVELIYPMLLAQSIGQMDPASLDGTQLEWAKLGWATNALQSLLIPGENPQLEGYLKHMHDVNVSLAYEMFAEGGVTPTEAQLAPVVQALDDMVALEVLQGIASAQLGGTLGSEQRPDKVMYAGIDILRETTALNIAKLPTAEELAGMSGEECTAAVEALLKGGGGAALQTRRASLQGEALHEFDRGFLVALGATIKAVQNDPAYRDQLGINKPGEIPPEYRGSILMMLAYVFGQMDKALYTKLVDKIDEYTAANDEYADTGDDENGHDPAMANSLNTLQLEMKAAMEAWSNNVTMGSSVMNTVGEALKSIWR